MVTRRPMPDKAPFLLRRVYITAEVNDTHTPQGRKPRATPRACGDSTAIDGKEGLDKMAECVSARHQLPTPEPAIEPVLCSAAQFVRISTDNTDNTDNTGKRRCLCEITTYSAFRIELAEFFSRIRTPATMAQPPRFAGVASNPAPSGAHPVAEQPTPSPQGTHPAAQQPNPAPPQRPSLAATTAMPSLRQQPDVVWRGDSLWRGDR
jgi:hypothetical protein